MIAESDRSGIQTLEIGCNILRCFARAAQPLTLTAVANEAGMAPGKVHRYLRGFIRAGAIIQDPSTRRYDLGPLAFSLGVAALKRHDLIREASSRLGELCASTGESASLLVWGDSGPVVIRSEESRRQVAVILRVGGTVPLTSSSAGHVFATYLPSSQTESMVAAELAQRPIVDGKLVTARIFAQALADVRKRGLAEVRNGVLSGTVGLSAPLLATDGRIIGVVSVAGRIENMDTSANGLIDRELRDFVQRIAVAPE